MADASVVSCCHENSAQRAFRFNSQNELFATPWRSSPPVNGENEPPMMLMMLACRL